MAKTSVYECLVIFDSNKYAQDPAKVGNQISALVTKLEGEVLVSRLWNDQKLAYPIDGHRKGTYWLTYFKLDSNSQPQLHRACQLAESILRNLILKVDDRLVDALVQHATSGTGPRIGSAVVVGEADDEEEIEIEIEEPAGDE